MKVTLKDIAERVGVSVNTVSLALRDMPSVKPETRMRILQQAEQMGYQGAKNKNPLRNIGLISTGERLRDAYFYMSFHQQIMSAVHEHNYDLMVFKGQNCDIEVEDLRRKFEANAIAGVIVLGDMEERIVAKVAQCGIPLVATGTRYDTLSVCTVIEDNTQGANQAIGYLRDRGYRSVGFIGQPLHSTGFQERYQGYVGALLRFGLPFDREQSILDLDIDNVYSYKHILQALTVMKKRPEAFLCANDNLALIALKAIGACGLRVPEDIALVGFDNSALGKMVSPSLTTVDVHCAVQAEMCVKRLMQTINTGENGVERIVLPVTLVQGESVRDLRD